MKLKVTNRYFTDLSTISELKVNDAFQCYILQPTRRSEGVKVPGKTAIPCAIYNLGIIYSPKHKRYVPLIEDVPNFTFVEIHIGNYPRDTEACLLAGRSHSTDAVSESTAAFEDLMNLIAYETGETGAFNCSVWALKEPSTIEIVDEIETDLRTGA